MFAGIPWIGFGLIIYLTRTPVSKLFSKIHREGPGGGGAHFEVWSSPGSIARTAVGIIAVGVLMMLNDLGLINLPLFRS